MNANISSKDQLIIDAYNRGAVAKEIAPLLNVTEKHVHKLWRQLGLPPRRAPKHSEELVERVIELYKQGKSYAEIGAECGLTRGQAAGILDRRGLLKTRALGRKRGPARPKTNQTNRIVRLPEFKKVPFGKRISAAPFLGLDLYQLTSKTCRNPDPKCDDPAAMTYCGQPVFGTLPYCAACAQINYRPAEARERAPRPR